MAGRGGGKKEIDPEELMRRKFRAKCQFRALGRMVMANTYWLSEGIAHYEGLEDVKRRVEQAVRGKTKKKQLLTINDKSLLCKDAEERTDQEKQYLYRIIGGLKCFKRYPNHVKRKLAAVTYFKYYGPNRAIVRQHQEAHALFFIVTGDVIVSQMIYDELLQKNVSVDVGVMHPGDMFGEVSLLHNIPRTATCTTADHCELLVLMKEDFKSVLQASVQKQWDEVRRAMSAFTYFDALDEVARREGCIVAKMKSYEPNETILGDGIGVANFVYFVLSGRCQMIESLNINVTTRLGKNFFSLYDPYVPPAESELDLDTKYFANLKTESAKPTSSESVEEPELLSPEKTSQESAKNHSKRALKSSFSKRHSSVDSLPKAGASNITQSAENNVQKSELLLPPSANRPSSVSYRFSTVPEFLLNGEPLVPKQSNIRTFFMQVCQLNPGSSFGFGENMRDRRIVALNKVDCMLLPKIWLLQRNTANIWTRIQHYLEKKIPTKMQLFKEFVSARRWQEYRDQLVSDVIARSNTVNWTSVHDVPYSIRMEEMLDI